MNTYKPTTTQRGYGTAHQVQRQRWQHTVNAGEAICTRCQRAISPTEPWDLDHTDDRTGYLGAAHRACNRAAGARNATKARLAKKQTTIREW